MVEYYKRDEFDKLKAQRKKTLAFFYLTLLIYAVISGGFLWWYLTLPYQSPQITFVKLGHYTVTGLTAIFAYVFIGIKLKRIKKYNKMLFHIETGLREESTASFFDYDNTIFLNLGVEMKAMAFLQWNKYKNDYYERRVMVPADKPFPEFTEGQMVKFVTQGNILVSYETLD